MSPSPRRVDLRLTSPAVAPYQGLAAARAGKFAEYAGAAADAAHALAHEVETSLTAVAAATPAAPVKLEMLAADHQLVVTLSVGATKKLTCPLSD